MYEIDTAYDKYGNIKTRNGIAYTYGNSIWKDQLTGYGDKSISYDSQGNPTSYLGHTLTWEKGRQLKKFDSNTYTYNANGIRTGKTVSGVKHSYRLDGTKILSEKWGTNILTPLYDNKEEVCGIVFNGASYYFLKNLQGDVISLSKAYNIFCRRLLPLATELCKIYLQATMLQWLEVLLMWMMLHI